MKLDFFNTPTPAKIESLELPQAPEFVTYKPDFELLERMRGQFDRFENVLVIANGGSINPFYGFYHALSYQSQKNVYFLNTVDPDYIYELKQKLSPESTVVFCTSKSGENTTQLESTMAFADYKIVAVTGKASPLRAIAEKMNWQTVMHPTIGGRYTGLTEVNLLPAAVAGLDVQGLYDGARALYANYSHDNLAWQAASVFYQLEEEGYVDVFLPIYSHYLFPMSAVIVQLCHESFGKGGLGQTYVSAEAPESQHHTNQRFFGGRKNMAGFFVGSESYQHPTPNKIPTQIHSVQIKGRHLADINNIPFEKSLEFELQGTVEDARINGIPLAVLKIKDFSAEEIGAFAAFWQLYAVYASALRKVDPFDQPQVESSKNISFNKRLQYKGLL